MSRTRGWVLALAVGLSACGGGSGSAGSGGQTSSAGNELVVLADDEQLQPVGNVVPVVNSKAMTPAMRTALDRVSEALSTDDLIALNRQVGIDRQAPVVVAQEYAAKEALTTGLAGGSGKVVVVAARSSEGQVLGHLYATVLDGAGFDATVAPGTDRELYLPALQRGTVQVAVEHVGTLTELLNAKANGPDAPAVASGDLDKTLAALRPLAEQRGLTVLTPSAAAHQDAFAVTRTFAEATGLQTLSDLAAHEGELVLGGPPDCPTSPYCQPGLQETYGIAFDSFLPLDAGGPLTKQALRQGRVQVGLVSSTDGSLSPATAPAPGTR